MLRKFNLDIYKPGETKVVTREGLGARIICTDYKGITGHTIIALVENGEGKEMCHEYGESGNWYMGKVTESGLDLFIDDPNYFNYKEGDLVIHKEKGYLILVGKSDNSEVIESMITINPKDLSDRIEDSFTHKEVRLAGKIDWGDFEFYLTLMKLSWKPHFNHFKQIEPELEFSPLPEGWEVSYNGRAKKMSDSEFKDLYGKL